MLLSRVSIAPTCCILHFLLLEQTMCLLYFIPILVSPGLVAAILCLYVLRTCGILSFISLAWFRLVPSSLDTSAPCTT